MSRPERTQKQLRRANRGNVPGVLDMAELAMLSGRADTVSEPRTPQWVLCVVCAHSWIGLYLPMPIRDAATAMGKLCCPMCTAGANRITCTKAPS